MRKLVLSISILLGAACTPGSGEYGSCTTTADCQVNLECSPPGDAGICRRTCDLSTDCQDSELCNPSLHFCSKDGGY